MIAPEGRAAALLAREGRGRDEPGERVRIVEQAPQPFRVALEARVAPDRLARGAGGGAPRGGGGGGGGGAARGPRGRRGPLGSRGRSTPRASSTRVGWRRGGPYRGPRRCREDTPRPAG